jgi:hypothetical protein
MQGQRYGHQFGTLQPEGPMVFGQAQFPMVTGIISYFIKRFNVVLDRKTRAQNEKKSSLPLIPFKAEGELNIERYDALFIARKDCPIPSSVPRDYNAFTSFHAYEKFETGAEYRLRWKFGGFAADPMAFDNTSQGKGIGGAVHAVHPYLNRSNEMIMSGEWITWEPNLETGELHDAPMSRRTRTFQTGSTSIVKGRLVKYRDVFGPDQIYGDPSLGPDAVLLRAYPSVFNDNGTFKAGRRINNPEILKVQMFLDLLSGRNDIIGWNATPVQPNEWGQVVF